MVYEGGDYKSDEFSYVPRREGVCSAGTGDAGNGGEEEKTPDEEDNTPDNNDETADGCPVCENEAEDKAEDKADSIMPSEEDEEEGAETVDPAWIAA